MTIVTRIFGVVGLGGALLLEVSGCGTSSLPPPAVPVASERITAPIPPGTQRDFGSPDDAVAALKIAAKAGDVKALHEIFGPESEDMASGDAVADANRREEFAVAINQFCRLAYPSENCVVLNIGAQDWPFPIPLVKKGERWSFDTAAGKDEIINRRVGENELMAIEVCRIYVDAQREYATSNHDHTGELKYAQKLKSTPGRKDGLYWEVPPGGEPSPFGPLVASARAEGYGPRAEGEAPRPFHGYLFKILTAQGAHAQGGKKDYIVDGDLTGGFALVAQPVQWGDSGVMTFIVNQEGKIYEADLGADTAAKVGAMTEFDPGAEWKPVMSNASQ